MISYYIFSDRLTSLVVKIDDYILACQIQPAVPATTPSFGVWLAINAHVLGSCVTSCTKQDIASDVQVAKSKFVPVGQQCWLKLCGYKALQDAKGEKEDYVMSLALLEVFSHSD